MTPWLLASFGLIAVLLTVEHRVVRPWAAQAKTALRGAVPVITIKALAGDRRALFGRLAMIALFALISALMTVKPGSDLLA